MTWVEFGTGSTFAAGNATLNVVMMPRVVMDAPVLQGEGPAEWSTCTDLDLDLRCIHDVNHYYKALGFSWPFLGISRRDLGNAWRSRQNDRYATYAFSQLLNLATRRKYDRAPFFYQLVDRYVLELARRVANQDLADAAARGQTLDLDDVLQHYGFDTEPNEPVVDEEVPLAEGEGFPSLDADGEDDIPERPLPWAWGYYTWRSGCDDRDRLGRWQRLLAAALGEHRMRIKLAIGFAGHLDGGQLVTRVGQTLVCFLAEGVEPDEELADQAAADVITRNQT
jgi:hypothetical protein